MAWMYVRNRECPVCGREMKIRGAHYVCETVNGAEEEAVNISYFCDGTENKPHHVDLLIRQGGDGMAATEADEEEDEEDEEHEEKRDGISD